MCPLTETLPLAPIPRSFSQPLAPLALCLGPGHQWSPNPIAPSQLPCLVLLLLFIFIVLLPLGDNDLVSFAFTTPPKTWPQSVTVYLVMNAFIEHTQDSPDTTLCHVHCVSKKDAPSSPLHMGENRDPETLSHFFAQGHSGKTPCLAQLVFSDAIWQCLEAQLSRHGAQWGDQSVAKHWTT